MSAMPPVRLIDLSGINQKRGKRPLVGVKAAPTEADARNAPLIKEPPLTDCVDLA